jgi:hypothetical protein
MICAPVSSEMNSLRPFAYPCRRPHHLHCVVHERRRSKASSSWIYVGRIRVKASVAIPAASTESSPLTNCASKGG